MINKFLAGMFWLILVVGPGPGATVAADDFSGKWVGEWHSGELGDGGHLEISISQSGTSLSGTATAAGASDCGLPLVVTLAGTVGGDGNTATFTDNTYPDPCITEQERISMSMTRSGNTLNGTYTSEFFDENTWNHGDSGTLSLDRVCCTIIANAGAGGTITPSGEVTLAPGASRTFTLAPDAGFMIDDLVVDGVSKGALASYNFTNIQADHVIAASFTETVGTLPFLPLLLDEDR
jgi:hypothetical protein